MDNNIVKTTLIQHSLSHKYTACINRIYSRCLYYPPVFRQITVKSKTEKNMYVCMYVRVCVYYVPLLSSSNLASRVSLSDCSSLRMVGRLISSLCFRNTCNSWEINTHSGKSSKLTHQHTPTQYFTI